LPATFSVRADGSVPNIHVADGVVEVYASEDVDEPVAVRGAVARLDANALTVFLPRAVKGVTSVDLNVDVNSVGYGDTLKLP
jgi:hypothetical protein